MQVVSQILSITIPNFLLYTKHKPEGRKASHPGPVKQKELRKGVAAPSDGTIHSLKEDKTREDPQMSAYRSELCPFLWTLMKYSGPAETKKKKKELSHQEF